MTVEGNPAGKGFTVGGVIGTTFSVLFANIIRFGAIILIVGVPVIGFFIGGSMLLAGTVTSGGGAGLNFRFDAPDAVAIAFFVTGALLTVLGYLLIICALIHGTLDSLGGRPVSIGACLAAGFSALPRVFAASLLLVIVGMLIGLVVGFVIAMILGGIGLGALVINFALSLVVLMIFARILVFIPAIMAERAGILDSFGRSQELTREHRWGIFGILLIFTVVNWIMPFASAALAAVAPMASDVFDIAFAAFFIALVSVLAGVAYHVLRTGKEGAPVGEVAKVFD